MKEISRLVFGMIALRVVEGVDSRRYCEIFESGRWASLSSAKAQEISSKEIIKKWLDEHYTSEDNVLKFLPALEIKNA